MESPHVNEELDEKTQALSEIGDLARHLADGDLSHQRGLLSDEAKTRLSSNLQEYIRTNLESQEQEQLDG